MIWSALLDEFLLRLGQEQVVDGTVDDLEPSEPVTKEFLLEMFGTSEWLGLQAAVVFAFNAALRVGEYTSKTLTKANASFTLLRSDVAFHASQAGYTFRLKASKSDVAFQGKSFTICDTPDPNSPAKILRRYMAWFDERFSPNSPLFRREDGQFLIRADVDRVIKRLAQRLGLEEEDYSTHGIRSGACFELADSYVRRGVPIDWDEIISFGRWSGESAKRLAQQYARFSAARAALLSEALRTDRAGDGEARTLRRRR